MAGLPRKIAIIGSTGSIGQQALQIIRNFPERFHVVALAAGDNANLLAQQVAEFEPWYVCCRSDGGNGFPGAERVSLEEIAILPEADMVLIAASGGAGLKPLMAAVRAGKIIALANKESLVAAGEVITAEAARSGAAILPVDSEHSAMWQCLRGEERMPSRLILTASGGPFLDYTSEQMESVTVEQALAHPSWKMGKKVTVDSATLLNKGLEIIEAHWLFGVSYDDIEVLIHPQSIVHSMVEFPDGSVKAQLSYPDMRLPIQYALAYPERLDSGHVSRLDWERIRALDFRKPDYKRFPCLGLAVEAGRKGGTYPAALCAADEVAVGLFLEGRIAFQEIPRLIETVLAGHVSVEHPVMEDIESADASARARALETTSGRRG